LSIVYALRSKKNSNKKRKKGKEITVQIVQAKAKNFQLITPTMLHNPVYTYGRSYIPLTLGSRYIHNCDGKGDKTHKGKSG
jgi:hypothetical protein